MEGLGEVKRGGRLVRTQTGPVKKSGAGLPSPAQGQSDRLALSRQALNVLEEHDRQLRAEERRQEAENELKSRKKLLDTLDKSLRAMNLCEKIAARVMRGDKVPPEDLRYLEKNDPEGFKLALAMRKPKKHPKEWESVLEDEDRTETENFAPSAKAAHCVEAL